MSFEGASVYNSGDYITPLGKITVNREIADRLIHDNKVFNFPVDAHAQEHSIEVQIPFIQYYFKETPPIVPIIIGTHNESTVKKIAEALRPYFTDENLFVISSDFSHYPSYAEANRTDSITAKSIESGKPERFLYTLKRNSEELVPGLATSMCGWTSGLTLLYLTEGDKNIEIKHIDYCNSGDSRYGNKKEVVGYHAFAAIGSDRCCVDARHRPRCDRRAGLRKRSSSLSGVNTYGRRRWLDDVRLSTATRSRNDDKCAQAPGACRARSRAG